MSTVLITKEMFNNLTYDANSPRNNTAATSAGDEVSSTVLIVFANSDINAAVYHLQKSLESPFAYNAVATVLVQESVKEDFLRKLEAPLKPYANDLLKHKDTPKMSKALETAKILNARIITAAKSHENSLSPSLVCDFTHEQLGYDTPSGVVTLHTFRTAKEAISLVNKESFEFPCVSIWHENHSYAYEIIFSLKSSFYFINCLRDPKQSSKNGNLIGENCVSVNDSYHYETLDHKGIQRTIVFPIGSIFAN